ncbi:hypothetical protein BHE74_00041451, partial [Ensete ventricosum]
MGLLCPNSLPAAISRVRYFPSYQSGVPDPTFRRFGPSRFYRRPPPSMAAFLPHENIGPVAAPKSPSGAFLSISCEHLWDDPSHPPVIVQLAGKNSHHIIEATFKAFARALRQAIEYDSRRGGSVP